jgi:hypothetical protein
LLTLLEHAIPQFEVLLRSRHAKRKDKSHASVGVRVVELLHRFVMTIEALGVELWEEGVRLHLL